MYKKKIDYGVVKIDKKKVIQKYSKNDNFYFVNAGFYAIKSDIFKLLKNQKNFESFIFNDLTKTKDIDYIDTKKWFPIDNKRDLFI